MFKIFLAVMFCLINVRFCYSVEPMKLWSEKVKEDIWWIEDTSDGKFLITKGKNLFSVLDGETGKKVWDEKFKIKGGVLVVEDAGIILMMGKNEITSIQIGTWEKLWKKEKVKVADASDIFLVEEPKGAIVMTEKDAVFLDLKTGNELWKSEKLAGERILASIYIKERDKLILLVLKR